MIHRILSACGATVGVAVLTVTLAVLGPAAPAAAAPHDCRTTARAQEMIDEAEESAGDAFGCVNHCPCGRTLVWDGERWEQSR